MYNFERRVRAFAIDMSTSVLLLFVLVVLLRTFSIGSERLQLIASTSTAYFGVTLIPNFFSKGQTFGKRTQKMKTVSVKTEKAPSLIICLLREIVKGLLMIWTFGFYLLVCGIMATSRKDGRSIHDLIFGTKVICLTLYVNDKKEQGYVLGKTATAKKGLKGSDYN